MFEALPFLKECFDINQDKKLWKLNETVIAFCSYLTILLFHGMPDFKMWDFFEAGVSGHFVAACVAKSKGNKINNKGDGQTVVNTKRGGILYSFMSFLSKERNEMWFRELFFKKTTFQRRINYVMYV